MDTDGVSSAETNDDAAARRLALTERQHELWDRLGNCRDEQKRKPLFQELAANREELARLEAALSLQSDEPGATSAPIAETQPPSSVGETLRAGLLMPPEGVAPATAPPPSPPLDEKPSAADDLPPVSEEAPTDSGSLEPPEADRSDPEPVEPPSEITGPIAPSAPETKPSTSREDDLAASLGSRQEEIGAPTGLEAERQPAHQTYQDIRQIRRDRPKRIPISAILVAVGAVGAAAVVAWLLFLSPGASTDTVEAATTDNIDTASTPVDQIRSVLDGLGHGSILVEERSGTIHLAGVLGSDSDRSAAIAASRALAGDMPVDSTGLTIRGEDGSTDPPASSVSQTETDGEDQQAVANPALAAGPYVEATLDGKDFVLAGVLPSAALASSYLRAAKTAYSPHLTSELVVDEQLEEVDWLTSGPDAIILLPMIVDGKLLISNGQVEMSGRSPDEAGVDRLRGALAQTTGLPVVVGDMEVMNLEPPSYVIAADAGVVKLSGQVPTEEIRDMLVEGAVAAYGAGNVTDEITVSQSVHPALWMYNGGPLMQAMATFPDYEIRFDGMALSGFINGGVDFESGSAVFTGDYARALDVGVSVLTRDPSLQLIIEGHTDDQGFKESNRALSQLRAEAVMDYFIINGIDPSRLTAVGVGEAEPVASNATEAGRARNRRIQYVLSTSM